MDKIINQLAERGFKIDGRNEPHQDAYVTLTNGVVSLCVRKCWSHNGCASVNYYVQIIEKTGKFSCQWHYYEAVKIPFDASDKVITNRLNKLLGE